MMDGPAFDTTRFVRPALLTIALYFFVFVISLLTMARPVLASGIVNATFGDLYVSPRGVTGTGFTYPAGVSYGISIPSLGPDICPTLLAYTWIIGWPQNTTPPYWLGNGKCAFNEGAVYFGLAPGPYFCPLNSSIPISDTSCVCNDGFSPDPARKSCVPAPLTISLGGLGGDVMPTKTRNAYALVIKSDGTPKSGAWVDLILTVVPENGDPILGSNVGSISPNGGATDTDGRLNFVFSAPQAGGTHTIDAFCTASGCTNYAEGKIRVPGCPIPPLSVPPFTDPVAAGFENGNRWRPDLLTADYQTKLACVQNAITAAGGTYTGTSAYRPTEYQQHLYEIVGKDYDLDPDYMTAHPECQALRDKVTGEMGGHGLKFNQLVAEPGTSRHESGSAFDLTPYGLTDAQLTPIYPGCGVSHTAVPGEPWHVQ